MNATTPCVPDWSLRKGYLQVSGCCWSVPVYCWTYQTYLKTKLNKTKYFRLRRYGEVWLFLDLWLLSEYSVSALWVPSECPLNAPPSDCSNPHLQTTHHCLRMTHITAFRWLISPPSDDSYHRLQTTHISYYHLQMTHITAFRWVIPPPSDDSYLILPPSDDSYHRLQMTHITAFRRLISPPSDDSYHRLQRTHISYYHLQMTHITAFRWLISPPSDDSYHCLQMTHITAFRWLISPPSDDSYHHLQMSHITAFKWVLPPPSDDSYHRLQMTDRWKILVLSEGGDMVKVLMKAVIWFWEGGDMGRRLAFTGLLSEPKTLFLVTMKR